MDDASPHAPRRSAVPRGLLGLLALVALVESFVGRYDLALAKPMAWDWRLAGRRDASAEVLCFGDSLVKFGVQPRVLEACLDRRAASYALYSGPPAASYFLLRRALKTRKRPAAVVVDFAMGILADGPRGRSFPWADLLRLREGAELARDVGDADLFAKFATARLLPSFRSCLELREVVWATIRGRRTSTLGVNCVLARNWSINLGAQLNQRVPASGVPRTVPVPAPGSGSWRCDPAHAKYVCRFLDLAAAHGVPVFWLLPPVTPAEQRALDRSGDAERYARFVRGALAHHPDLTIVDARHAGYDPSLFIDPVHLDRQGATVLTADLADVVGERLAGAPAGSRWVDLPAYRERPIDVDLEDTRQSLLALGDRRTRLQLTAAGRPGKTTLARRARDASRVVR